MKESKVFFSAFAAISAAVSLAAPTPGQGFYLKIVGGNALTSGAVLRDNNTYDLGVTPAPYYSNPPYGDHPLPISVSAESATTLIVSPTNPHPGPISGHLALVQAGEWDWTLSKAYPQPGGTWNVGPGRDGAVVKESGWNFAEVNGKTVLRWALSNGKWVVVKTIITPFEGAPYERWVVHWVEGTGTTPGEQFTVDLEVSAP
ncbi:hypothetical protein CC80DRAFT_508231 [Byssothecium circinans]|uniref:Uncharacterized protein n=1 Tax=Byssothecium circinans TaxID=147558 RepID=A0A6A5TKD0_9PLEO|nr:hypothetical protein CC80DRAFT_508231 [Byssothecium circinans]